METIRRGLRGGFGPALRVQLGSIIGDMTWCSVALLGLAPLAQVAWLRVALGVVGVALLVYLGGMGIRDSFKMPIALTAPVTETKSGSFRSGMAISMANPMAVGYWLSVGGALVAAGVAGSTPAQTASFVAGFLGGTFAWAFVMALAVRWGKQLLTPVAFRAVTFVCGAAMLVFGFSLASQMISNLL
jgi:chemosensory pili system protein ChpE